MNKEGGPSAGDQSDEESVDGIGGRQRTWKATGPEKRRILSRRRDLAFLGEEGKKNLVFPGCCKGGRDEREKRTAMAAKYSGQLICARRHWL